MCEKYIIGKKQYNKRITLKHTKTLGKKPHKQQKEAEQHSPTQNGEETRKTKQRHISTTPKNNTQRAKVNAPPHSQPRSRTSSNHAIPWIPKPLIKKTRAFSYFTHVVNSIKSHQ
ncbi:unnamed protein product [Trifolium pratense]|uniref:Uncharacterized protein n=1 Tax=Trifolium pratense TaxID=57577 RepID=A0ACB0IQJ5_TRIPR|nr:unnamed protein product [Trifolium pratense]